MKIVLSSLLLLVSITLHAQYLEAGMMVGASNYLGDLANNSSQVYFKETNAAVGVFGRYNLHQMFTLKAGINYARIRGTDANSTNESIRRRNLSFRSSLLEFALTGEVNLPGYQPYALSKPISPYLFGGIALTSYNPKAQYQGEWVALRSLGTEGQGMPSFENPYSKVALAIPLGIGLKVAINDSWNIGLEAGVRKSFTDYLDDVGGNYVEFNQLAAGNGPLAAALGNRTGEYLGTEPVIVSTGTRRGDSSKSDWYFMAGIFVSYNFLDNGLVGSRSRTRKKAGCPT
jgi:hypothetical protein